MTKQQYYMTQALSEAKKAFALGEVPIGACVVKDGKVISKGYNKREKTKNAINHAEIIAIKKACRKLHDWRLLDCSLYVTLTPCPMCAGAIVNARIKDVHYGADEKSEDNLCEKIFESTRLNHNTTLIKEENYSEICAQLLSNFFKSKRKK